MKIDMLYDMHDILIEEGREEGMEKATINIIRSMLLNGISPERIAKITDIDFDLVQRVSLSK